MAPPMKLGAFGGLFGSLIRLPRIVSERLRAPQQHGMHAQNGRGAEETPPGKEGWWPGSARAGTFVRVRVRAYFREALHERESEAGALEMFCVYFSPGDGQRCSAYACDTGGLKKIDDAADPGARLDCPLSLVSFVP